MQRAQAQDLGLAGAVWGAGVVEIHAFEALEEPTHGRPGGGFAHLVGHGLYQILVIASALRRVVRWTPARRERNGSTGFGIRRSRPGAGALATRPAYRPADSAP